jgi:TP901 family phage tail tape measure protein
MADVQSNIQVSIDTTQALASIKNLQRQISAFHSSMAKGGAAANAVSTQMQQTLLNSINAGGKFSAQIKTIKTTTESFTDALQKNKFSIGEYFRYAGGASKTFGKLFKTEFDTINKVARENVKDLQTQYIRLGRDASGAMKSIAVRPLALDMNDLGTKTQIAAQKQALLNQLLKQGSTNLLNFGKNTQWAGRQLMVGFTLPLMAVGSAASKTFMDMETQAIRFKKVYGDLFTPQAESQKALKEIEDLGREFTKYGIAVSSTVGLAAEAAAAGFQGVDLQRQTAAATKLSILGQVESQKALETTIALQNAFSMSSENLAESIDFLNAVENQTVLSLDDMSTAIPKAAPVVQQLGGDVKDLAFLMTAMKEGGINASEGANALKSGLASLINPTGKANDMLLSFGINAKKIVVDNKGDLKKTVIEFATALNQLDPLNRAQTIEQMFGKFQFARLSTLFANVTKEGTQAARVLDLAGASVQDLAAMSEKELGMTSESAMNKFRGAVESLKLSLVPLGEEFLKAVTPVAEFITKILDRFNGLSDNTKKVIVTLTAIIGGLGPVFLMTFGLLANGIANIIKGFTVVKSLFNKTGQETGTLGNATKYMTAEQRNAAAVAASLDQVHTKLRQTFTSEAAAVNLLTQAYQRAVLAQASFMPVAAPMGRGPVPTKRAKGKPAIVGGTGNKDSELALLMPGETVIPTKMSQKYGGIINAMIADRVPGYKRGLKQAGTTGLVASHLEGLTPAQLFGTLSDPIMKQVLSVLPDVGVSLKALSTTADGMVTVGGTIETSLKDLATTLSENNIENATAIGTKEFSGTTTPTSSQRNSMLNSARIAGEPITFEQIQEASTKAQSYISRPVANETDLVRVQRQEAQKLIQEHLELERSLSGLSQQEVEVRKADFTKIKTTQALEHSLIQKGMSASEASTLAKQQIADAEKSIAKLVQDSKTDLEKRKIKEAAYKATLLKEMGLVAGYDEKRTKTDVFNRTQLSAVTRDLAKGQTQFGTPYKAGEQVPSDAAVFGSGKSFMGLKGRRISRNQSAIVDKSDRDKFYADKKAIRDRMEGFKSIGAKDTKSYDAGAKSVKVKDPYEASTASSRKSPHPKAAKDGKDDARAYATARDKELRRQSGRSRRADRPQGPAVAPVVQKTPRRSGAATRPQGPAPIGATPLPGMRVLNVVPADSKTPPTPTRTQLISAKARGLGGKMTGMGGGMGLLGVNMGLSMLPDFAGKGIMQGGLAGANLGMMFGGYGMAAGAAIGTVASALNSLNEKMKEHAAISRSTFSTSTSLITAFGDKVLDTSINVINLNQATDNLMSTFGVMTPEIKAAVDAILSLPEDNPMSLFLKKISDGSLGIKSLTGEIRSNLSTAISVGGLDPKNAEAYVRVLLQASGRTADFAEVWKSVSKSVVDAQTATTTSLNKMYDNIISQGDALTGEGIAFSGASQFWNEEYLLSYESLTTAQATFADGMLNLFNVLTNGSLTFEEIQERLNGIKGASFNAAQGVDALQIAINNTGNADLIGRFASIKQMFKDTGTEAEESVDKIIAMALALNTIGDDGLIKFANENKIPLLPGSGKYILEQYMESKQFKDALAAQKKFKDALLGNDYQEYNDGTDKAKTASELYLEVLDKEIKGLEEKRDAQKNVNDESQRQIDLQMKMKNLANEAVLAKISGDYIKAASLQQQAQNVQMEFDQETELRKKDAEIARLRARAEAIKDGAKLTKAEKAKIPKNRVEAASGGMIRGAGTGTSDSIPALLSNGEYVIKADSVNKYGVDTFNALNAGKFKEGGPVTPRGNIMPETFTAMPDTPTSKIIPKPKKKTPKSTMKDSFIGQRDYSEKNQWGYKNKSDRNSIKNWYRYFKDNMSRNLYIPGSQVIPDSREYWPTMNLAMGGIVKAYKEGGLASRPKYGTRPEENQNWFQRYVSKLTKAHDSSFMGGDALGVVALLRGLAGQSRKGDAFAAAMLPLSFTGLGPAKGGISKTVPGLSESALAKIMAKWKPVNPFAPRVQKYDWTNTDPLHGPLFIGKADVGGAETRKSLSYRLPKNEAGKGDDLIGLSPMMSSDPKYLIERYMAGDKAVLARMKYEQSRGLNNHPLSIQSLFRSVSKPYRGTLYRGMTSQSVSDTLPKHVVEAIEQARLTGDFSALVGKDFIMRRASFSSDPSIASYFAPGYGSGPSSSLLLEAKLFGRKVTPTSEMFPDKKFQAPYGQNWGGGRSSMRYQSEMESLVGGKFIITGFDGKKLLVQQKAKGGLVEEYKNGGLIKGPGTSKSDSIRATLGYAGGGSIRVSNGEYVVKASSVKDYGVNAMNAVNNGTATIGTNSGGTVYNINMPITSNNANPEGVANEVMRRLKLEVSKNNKSNKVGL